MSDPEEKNSSVNLVYIINSIQVGGAEVGMCRLINGLNIENYDLTVISLDGYDANLVRTLPPEIRVIDLQIRSGVSIKKIYRLLSMTQNADVIVGSLFHSVMIARICGVLNSGAKVITWQHNEKFKSERRKRLIGLTNKLSDEILADSLPVKQMYTDIYNLDSKSIRQVPISGIEIDEFKMKKHANSESVIVGSIGSLTSQKNYTTLIDIANELPKHNFKFRIAGVGPRRKKLELEAEDQKLKNIEFLGRVDHIPSFLEDVDIYIQPSSWEGLCITVIEAMAAGLPIVGSDVGGIGMNVKRSKCGYVYHPNDVSGFVEAIEILSSDPSLRQELGSRGRALVKDAYTQEILVEKFENAILK